MNGLERRLPKRWTEAEDKILYNEARGQRKYSYSHSPVNNPTKEEEKKCSPGTYIETLILEVTTGQIKDWSRIAAKLPGRTNKDCRKRWVNKVCGSLKKGAWEEDEDQRLRNAVCLHGQK